MIKCWGEGGYGQLGYGNTVTIGGAGDPLPRDVGDVDLPGLAVDISAGDANTCAILEEGSVYCWGSNGEGQLGLGHTEDIGDDETPGEAGAVALGDRAVDVSVGWFTNCAVLESGDVRCWGQLSGSDWTEPDERPVDVPPIEIGEPAVEVCAAAGWAAARTEAGEVYAWGTGVWLADLWLYGGDAQTPAERGPVDVGGVVTQLACGMTHICALLDSGAVRCWGEKPASGHPEVDRLGDDEPPSAAGDVNVGDGFVVEIAGGSYWSCARFDDGRLRCWGWAGDPLGYANLETIGDDEVPAAAGDLDLGGPATTISSGGYRRCATVGLGVRCWGWGDGPLGYGHDESIGDDETPAQAGDVPLL